MLDFYSNIIYVVPIVISVYRKKFLICLSSLCTMGASGLLHIDSSNSKIFGMDWNNRFLFDYFASCNLCYYVISSVVCKNTSCFCVILFNHLLVFIVCRYYNADSWWDIEYYGGIIISIISGLSGIDCQFIKFHKNIIFSLLSMIIGIYFLLFNQSKYSHSIWHILTGLSISFIANITHKPYNEKRNNHSELCFV